MKWKRIKPGLYFAEADGVRYEIERETGNWFYGMRWVVYDVAGRQSSVYTLAEAKRDAEWRAECRRKVAPKP